MDDVLNGVPAGFVSFGDDGKVTAINDTLLELLGYRAGELVGHHVEQLLTVGSRIFYQTHWFPLLRLHGRAEEIFLLLRAADGSEVGALVNAVRNERDGAPAYDCIVMRVRERQKYETALLDARRAAERARSELEARQRQVEAANEELEAQALELELQQQQLQQLAGELQERAAALESINATLEARTQEAEQLRTTAEEANEAKSRFLAVMSHELRTPLNAITGYIQLLELGVRGDLNDGQRELLARVDRAGKHLLRLINQVLSLARIESGIVDYELSDLNVREVVTEVLPIAEQLFRDSGIDFRAHLDGELAVHADREKTQQILLNLLGNAAKFTPAGGTVALRAAPDPGDGGCIALSVSDSGIGVPAAMQEEIFQPFVQVDSSRTRSTEGSGLGLAISRDLARGMGGNLTVRSVPGEGSTFTLTLPTGRTGSRTDPAATAAT